jgi:uncharacterized protein
MPASPSEVFGLLIDGITNQRWDQLPALYADDVVVEQPMNVPGRTRIDGIGELREHFGRGTGLPIRMTAEDIIVHETADPEVIVAEFVYVGEVTATGRTFRTHNVIVMRVRDGKIVESRDYHDHHTMAQALQPAD